MSTTGKGITYTERTKKHSIWRFRFEQKQIVASLDAGSVKRKKEDDDDDDDVDQSKCNDSKSSDEKTKEDDAKSTEIKKVDNDTSSTNGGDSATKKLRLPIRFGKVAASSIASTEASKSQAASSSASVDRVPTVCSRLSHHSRQQIYAAQ